MSSTSMRPDGPHPQALVFLLQLRWAKQTLDAARMAAWKTRASMQELQQQEEWEQRQAAAAAAARAPAYGAGLPAYGESALKALSWCCV